MRRRLVYKIRRGTILVQIWLKRTRGQQRYSLTVVRLFRNGEEWKQSALFGQDDIPLMRLLLNEAHTWIYQQGHDSNGDSAHSNGDSR